MNRMEMKKKRTVITTQLIWLLNLIVIANLMKDNGIAYLAAAFEVYMLVVALTVYVLPDAMAKLIRARMMKGQYHNADMVLRSATMLGTVVCAVVGILIFCFSDVFMSEVLGSPYGAITLRMLMPAYILTVIAQTLRGYFQGMGTYVPTGVSKILEQILILGSSVFVCILLQRYGHKISALLQNDSFTEAYGAMGVSIGIVIGLLLTVLFLFLIYAGYRKGTKRQGNKENGRGNESLSESSTLLILTAMPYLFMEIPGHIVMLCGLAFYNQLAAKANAAAYGAYYGKYMVLVTGAVLLMALFLIPMGNEIVSYIKKEEIKNARDSFQSVLHWLCIVGFFMTVCYTVLADNVVKMFYWNDNSIAGALLTIGAAVIVLGGFAVLFHHILCGLGKSNVVMINGLAALTVYIVSVIVMFRFLKMDMKGLVCGAVLYIGMLVILDGTVLFRKLKVRADWLHLAVIPLGIAAVSGLIMKLLAFALKGLLGSVTTGIISLVAGLLSYMILLLSLRNVQEQELLRIPAGKWILRIAKAVHLL